MAPLGFLFGVCFAGFGHGGGCNGGEGGLMQICGGDGSKMDVVGAATTWYQCWIWQQEGSCLVVARGFVFSD